jgi:hypothetical protein
MPAVRKKEFAARTSCRVLQAVMLWLKIEVHALYRVERRVLHYNKCLTDRRKPWLVSVSVWQDHKVWKVIAAP